MLKKTLAWKKSFQASLIIAFLTVGMAGIFVVDIYAQSVCGMCCVTALGCQAAGGGCQSPAGACFGVCDRCSGSSIINMCVAPTSPFPLKTCSAAFTFTCSSLTLVGGECHTGAGFCTCTDGEPVMRPCTAKVCSGSGNCP
jgi:hypothetical protein